MRVESPPGSAASPAGESSRHGRFVWLVPALLLAATGVLYVVYTQLGRFKPYDDEGYMIATVQHWLDGHKLYDELNVVYGPFYYGYRWVIHGLFGVPLGNDAIRLGSILVWVLSALLFAWTVYRLCRFSGAAVPLACLCFTGCILHLHVLANEPGHPQEAVVALIAIAFWSSSLLSGKVPGAAAFMLGAIAGALLLTKINAGFFFLMAVALALLVHRPEGWWLKIARYAAFAGAVSMPALLIRAHLHQPWAQRICLGVTIGLLACWTVGRREARGSSCTPRQLLLLGLGLGATTFLSIGFVLWQGSSLRGIGDAILLRPLRFPGVFGWRYESPTNQVLLATAAGAVAAGLYVLRPRRLQVFVDQTGLPWLKLMVGAVALSQSARVDHFFPWIAAGPLALLGFLWLAMVVPAGHQASPGEFFLRRLIAFVACLQPLQLYPVPGSQVGIGTIAFVPLGALLVADALPVVFRGFQRVLPAVGGRALRWIENWGLVLLALGLLLPRSWQAGQAYQKLDAVHLAGSRWTRMTEEQGGIYRFLADTVRTSADTFLCNRGLNSLYGWAGKRPASHVVLSHTTEWLLPSEVATLVESNQAILRLIYIEQPNLLTMPGQFASPVHESPLSTFVRQELTPRVRVGDLALWTRKDRADLVLRSCAHRVSHGQSEVLQLSFPENSWGGHVTGIEVVDLKTQIVLARTSSNDPGRRALLRDREQNVLLPGGDRLRVPSSGHAWSLAVPAQVDLALHSAPAVRFFDGARRVVTLPIIVDVSEAFARTRPR